MDRDAFSWTEAVKMGSNLLHYLAVPLLNGPLKVGYKSVTGATQGIRFGGLKF